MYLLNITHSQPVAAVEPHVPSHGAWVKRHLDAGTFLFAGPKKSGLGGVILFKAIPKPELQELLATIRTRKPASSTTRSSISTASSPHRRLPRC